MRIAQVAPLSESVPPTGYGGTERVVSFLRGRGLDWGLRDRAPRGTGQVPRLTTCLRFRAQEEVTNSKGGMQEVRDAALVDSLRPVSLDHRPPENIDQGSRFSVNAGHLHECDHFSGALPPPGGVVSDPDRADDLEDLTHCQVRPRGEHDGCPVDADVDQRNFIARSSSAKNEATDSERRGVTGLSPQRATDERTDTHGIMNCLPEQIPIICMKRSGRNDPELRSAGLHNLPHLLQLDEECVQNITTIPTRNVICPFSVFTFAPLSKIGEFA